MYFLLVLRFKITHTHTKTLNAEANRMTHPYKYILTPPVMCSQLLFVSHQMNNLLIFKIYFTEFCNISAFQKVLTCRSHLSVEYIH